MSDYLRDGEIKFIQDPVKRRNAKCKRSKYLFKKAYELSMLTSMDVNISIYDPKMHRVTEFASNSEFKLHDLFAQLQDQGQSPSPQRRSRQLKYKVLTSRDFTDDKGNFIIGRSFNVFSEQLTDCDDHNEIHKSAKFGGDDDSPNEVKNLDLDSNPSPSTSKQLLKWKFKSVSQDFGQTIA